ncbi:hypothetical protein [Streptomyces violaceusniger]|uniref:Uncharacterized protein n=1 Tax=Streptomyces violaceusniger (strain Tu 4113) TaxID=653045 RepID=G2PHT0_STRV4|nr:hypothetical protein [Streptomyces violaceusniger]AEM88881.1 hypothetical protein Strvi_0105 [Streptomyces violaceusniger Tu 4113]
MTIPTADAEAERIDFDLARLIARSLNEKQAHQLRNIYERDLHSGGWSDHRVNQALHRRGLVRYIVSDISYHRGGGVWKTRIRVTDVKPTFAGVQVLEEWEILHAPGGYGGPELGSVQRYALECLVDKNSGRWWPGCGWSMTSAFQTTRILDTLVARGLAERGATEAGDPMFTVTPMGRAEARPHWRKLLDVRNLRETRLGKDAAQSLGPRRAKAAEKAKPAGSAGGHGYRWRDVREVEAMGNLDVNDVFVKPGTGTAYTAYGDGSVTPRGLAWGTELDGIAWTVKGRIGETFICESHTGRHTNEILRAGVRVLKVVTSQNGGGK